MKHSLIKKLKKRGGIVLKPNPILENWILLRFSQAANRYHQKVKLIDDNIFIGSLNCNNQYSGKKYGTFDYIDLNLYLKNSPCAGKVSKFFQAILRRNKKRYTIKNETEPIPNESEQFLEETPPTISEISDSIIKMLEEAKESITIIQSYYLNIPKVEEILLRAIKRGVKVEIITAKKRDQLSYRYFLNEILFENLLKNGANVYEFLDKSFHMKAYCVDNKIINLGSFNHDVTSFICNNEANYLIKKNKYNGKLFLEFEELKNRLKKNCDVVKYNKNPSSLRVLIFRFCSYGLFTFCRNFTLKKFNK